MKRDDHCFECAGLESSHTVTHPNDHTKGSSACTSFAGSVTIEAALAFPLFICIAVMLWFGFNLMVLHAGVENSLMRGMGTYSSFYADEAAKNVWMYDFYKDMDGDELKRLGVRGGKTGIFAAAAESSGNLISIEAIYTAKEPVLGAGIFSKGVMQTVYGKSFTGYIPGSTTAKNDDTEYMHVYMAENGVVYHVTDECTYLKLHLRQVPAMTLDELRNDSGHKYYECEKCCHGHEGFYVWITDDGTKYHTDRHCPGIKRTYKEVVIKEDCDTPCCSRCGGSR